MILIADDDPVICMLAARILGSSYQVSSCNSGAGTPKKAAELKPDLVLLDINLGDMSGFEVLRALRENPETCEIPVMFITGASDRDAEIRCFRGGASDFIRKPFVPEVLLQRAQRIIALDHLQRNLRSEVRHQALRADIHIWQGSDRLWTFTEEQGSRAWAGHTEMALTVDGDAKAPVPGNGNFFESLRKTGEIQIEEGLRYCGTEEEYMDTLRFYAANAPVAVNEIHSLWSDGNLADTTVKVHAIKSMSRCIGALSIGDLAEKLEQAGKAGDANALGARLDELLARIRKLCSEIHQM
jgi:CheY-like chemotaxis protein/HPt (histidine-containing phosphotransfer) domain-containing protein